MTASMDGLSATSGCPILEERPAQLSLIWAPGVAQAGQWLSGYQPLAPLEGRAKSCDELFCCLAKSSLRGCPKRVS